MTGLDKLNSIREATGPALTTGLGDEEILRFLADGQLAKAIDEALDIFQSLPAEQKTWAEKPEAELIAYLQDDYLSFYKGEAANPYVPLTARGPWLITLYGAVLHDSGGYGMLGFGQGPQSVLEAMSKNQVMANIMTASLSQRKFTEALRKEIGHSRADGKQQPYTKFLCLNSGSESVSVAARIADLNACQLTNPGERYEGREIKFLSFTGSFHGRTDRPAQASGSTMNAYRQLASFRDRDNAWFIEPNNVAELEAAYEAAERENVFIEMMLLEPVMGEGNPGQSVTPEFYRRARELTREHSSLLLVDSIQAGLRTRGCLSIVDYPGFGELDAPDMETYSKAINAGQYPLSVLALTQRAVDIFRLGIYGNTMTANPRALDVATAVLEQVTPELRRNIVARGDEIIRKFEGLAEEFPGVVTGCKGTGLLCALDLNPEGYLVVGNGGLEECLRKRGIGVIHGGKNALRFTPHFNIASREIDLIVGHIRAALKQGPVYGGVNVELAKEAC